jgi:hypothetical protein
MGGPLSEVPEINDLLKNAAPRIEIGQCGERQFKNSARCVELNLLTGFAYSCSSHGEPSKK